METVNFIYSKEIDSLAVFTNRKAYASIEFGRDIIIDVDRRDRVTGVEILNPDKHYGIPKKLLNKISSASMKTQRRGDLLGIFIRLKIEGREEKIPILLPI